MATKIIFTHPQKNRIESSYYSFHNVKSKCLYIFFFFTDMCNVRNEYNGHEKSSEFASIWFVCVCVEVLRPIQPIRSMSSDVEKIYLTTLFLRQVQSSKRLTSTSTHSFARQLPFLNQRKPIYGINRIACIPAFNKIHT